MEILIGSFGRIFAGLLVMGQGLSIMEVQFEHLLNICRYEKQVSYLIEVWNTNNNKYYLEICESLEKY